MMCRPACYRSALALLLGCVFASSAYGAIPTPLTSAAPVPLDRVRQNSPYVLQLAGMWRFQLTHGAITPDGFRAMTQGPATASSAQSGRQPADALDGMDALRTGDAWCADSGSFPQWWMVDLGRPEDVSGLSIDWEFKDAFYRFKVEGSLDAHNWKLLADRTADPGAQDGPAPITRSSIRFLRITVIGAHRPNGDTWACMRHVHITVVRDGKASLWMAHVAPEDPAARDTFARTDFSDKNWANIPVPSNWEMEGFSRPTYDNPDDAVGLYRRSVDVPAGFAGKRVFWHFDGVNNGAEIFINGERVAYHESGFTAFDVDVTAALRPGERNLLALRVTKRTPSVDLDTGDFWCLGGIYRENYLVALPPTHVQDITVVTDLDARYRDATLTATVAVAGTPGAEVSLQGALFSSGGSRVPGVDIRGTGRIGADGSATIPLQAAVTAPGLWSAEKPDLYYLELALSDGAHLTERVQERFGFRKIEIRNGVLLWNGVPIKCTGTCRHEEWAAYGHALNEKAWRTDLKLMKACNINAVRTSHYNHAARFLELCDEVGIYVLDEVPACWCNVSDPSLKAAFVQRTRETLARDKDRPCVLAWSLTNESGYGPNAQAMLDYAKANDPTRPAFISQCGPWNSPEIDFQDTHYPSFAEVKRMATEKLREATPLVMTEQPHIFYVSDGLDYDYGEKDLWGQVLARNWSVVWPTDAIIGSFIWEWQDQGIADRFPGREDVGPDGLRGNNHKGIVDGYRNVKPEYWNVKMVYSPVTTAARDVEPIDGNCVVPLQNRYSFTDLSELTCRWQALAGNRILASGVSHIDCAPRTSTDARFPATPGMDALRIELFHPDGRSLYAARLRVRGSPLPAPPAPLAAAGAVKLDDQSQEVRIDAAGTRLIVDRQTGMLRSWQVDGKSLLAGGPMLNLGEHRANHGDHDARDFVESKAAPQLKNATVTAQLDGDIAHVSVTGDVYLVESPERKAQLTYTLDVHPDAQVDVNWKLTWLAADANAWELGMTLLLPSSMDRMAWFRDGYWTEYPKDHIGATEGTATSRDLTFRCTKRDARWLWMSGGSDVGLAALRSDTPLHVRAQAGAEGTTVFLSSAVAPPYDFSTNLVPDMLIHLRQNGSETGSFRLRVTGGGGAKAAP